MSARQIQIRRGTEDEHANFTGALGEVTMDTTNKTLRVHDGETVGGPILAKKDEVPDINSMDYVIECQEPTAENNYAWYRRYKSGWVEQGGYYSMSGNWGAGSSPVANVVLPIQMCNTSYSITMARGSSSGLILTSICKSITTTGFSITNYCTASATAISGWWRVEGYSQATGQNAQLLFFIQNCLANLRSTIHYALQFALDFLQLYKPLLIQI